MLNSQAYFHFKMPLVKINAPLVFASPYEWCSTWMGSAPSSCSACTVSPHKPVTVTSCHRWTGHELRSGENPHCITCNHTISISKSLPIKCKNNLSTEPYTHLCLNPVRRNGRQRYRQNDRDYCRGLGGRGWWLWWVGGQTSGEERVTFYTYLRGKVSRICHLTENLAWKRREWFQGVGPQKWE